jgi:iron complex outermembrane recepter protein
VNLVRRTVSSIIGTTFIGVAFAPIAQSAQADDALEEVVVTATRQSDSVNRVALSVSAQTQQSLDQRGIQTISDLQAVVPGLRINGQEASGNATVAIRGIRQQSGTSATTGFYLDETPLQKRAAGGFASQNGTPVPPLFDLERVEVLRGPQGTLFGGGSEGGTIRYIQPAPSLSGHSGYARAQWLTTEGGDPGYEVGAAFGSSIKEDTLGFRVSLFTRKTGGYIDLTNWKTGEVYDENANSGEVLMGRAAVAWKPSESTKLTLSYLKSRDETDNLGSSYNLDEPGQLQVSALCFNVPLILSLPVPQRAFLVPPDVLPPNPGCNANTGAFVAPAYNVGPFNLERFQSLALGHTPTRTDLEIGSADFQWDLSDDMQLKSITSFVNDLNRGQSPQNFPVVLFVHPGTARIVTPGLPNIAVPTGSGFNANVTSTPDGLGLGALIRTNTNNKRNVFSQEVRLSSTENERVSYVAGAFFSNTRSGVNQFAEASDLGFRQFSGMGIEQRYGVPFEGFFSKIHESVTDLETAAFGDVTVRLTDQWRFNAGLRLSYLSTSFEQSNYGPNGGTSSAAQSTVSGVITDTPVTPKVSIQYFLTPDNLFYVTAAKGFRAGGVNQVLTSAADGSLAQYGLTTAVMPKTYESDSVWSYELGGKMRLWEGRAQINAAIYDLEWTDVQTFLFLGDGVVFNVPSARSRGAELEGQIRPFRPLTFDASIAYIKAEYTSSLIIPAGPGSRAGDLVIAQDGQEFAQPAWTVNLGARYDIQIGDSGNAYARLDYRWFDGYATAVQGTGQYSPDSSEIPSQMNLNLRIGYERGNFDVNVFALNLTDEQTGAQGGGRSQCTNADCSTYNSYSYGRTLAAPTPRQIGVQVAYRLK